MRTTPAPVSITKCNSSGDILTAKATYESWHPLNASPRIYSHVPLPFKWGYEGIGPDGRPVGLMGVVFTDETFAGVGGAVDPRIRGNGVGSALLEALLSEIPAELTVVVGSADKRTSAPTLLASHGFYCEDAEIVATFLHDLEASPQVSKIPVGYTVSPVITVAPGDLERVIELEKVWCRERNQPVGPRLIDDYGAEEGFVVLARAKEGEVIGLANAELTNVDGFGLAGLFVVDPAHRRLGIGHALKQTQLSSARNFGWKQLLVTVPEPDHPAARINAEFGGRGIDSLKWVRPPLD